MKKVWAIGLAAALVFALCTACAEPNDSIVGTWIMTEHMCYHNGELEEHFTSSEANNSYLNTKYKFEPDGTFTLENDSFEGGGTWKSTGKNGYEVLVTQGTYYNAEESGFLIEDHPVDPDYEQPGVFVFDGNRLTYVVELEQGYTYESYYTKI